MAKKKVNLEYNGVFEFDDFEADGEDRLGGNVIYQSKTKKGYSDYPMSMENFIALGRPEKIKITGTIEVVK